MKSKILVVILMCTMLLGGAFYVNAKYEIRLIPKDMSKKEFIAREIVESKEKLKYDGELESRMNELKEEIPNDRYVYVDMNIKTLEALNDTYFEIYEKIESAIPDSYEDILQKTKAYRNPRIIATFENQDGELNLIDKDDKYFEDEKLYDQIWNYSKKLIPSKYLGMIKYYKLNTDGRKRCKASISGVPKPSNEFVYSVDLKDAARHGRVSKEELTDTIIHELGHLITINESQIGEYDLSSDRYTIDAGTLKEDAYLNLFYNKFWKDNSIKDKVEQSADPIEIAIRLNAEFVSTYAASDPTEDIAESFRVFVTEKKPKVREVVDQKILFFYDFEELVKLREEIRANISN